jgi:hypothetical protein
MDDRKAPHVPPPTHQQPQPWLMSSDARAVRARTVILIVSTAVLTALALLTGWLTA